MVGNQIVKGIVEPGESPKNAAVRELLEESGVVASSQGTLGSLKYDKLAQEWHFVLCRSDPLPNGWTHWTHDDGVTCSSSSGGHRPFG